MQSGLSAETHGRDLPHQSCGFTSVSDGIIVLSALGKTTHNVSVGHLGPAVRRLVSTRSTATTLNQIPIPNRERRLYAGGRFSL
jgi:hypothetical protein